MNRGGIEHGADIFRERVQPAIEHVDIPTRQGDFLGDFGHLDVFELTDFLADFVGSRVQKWYRLHCGAGIANNRPVRI